MSRSPDVVVVGGGVIGCAVAYYVAKRGLTVTLVDLPKRGRATSASAGGLWPLGESVGLGCGVIFYKALAGMGTLPDGVHGPGQLPRVFLDFALRFYKALAGMGTLPDGVHGPGQLPRVFLDFALRSNAMFPALAGELREASGIDFEFERTSLLFLMYDEGDVAFAKPLWERCPCGKDLTEWLTPEELAKAEPAVTRAVRGALRFHGDDQVNPYRLADSFRAGARNLGATILTHTEVTGIRVESSRVVGVDTAAGPLACDLVVNAAGAWAPDIGRMVGLKIPVRPVRGQIIGTETLPKVLSACLSTTDCYLAQKGHGEIIIGSTTEEVGFEVGTTPGALKTLSAGALRAVPFLKDVRVKRVWSGLRPGSPDELPILGPVEGVDGYLNACGHFRTGILTSPLTGQLVAELAVGDRPSFPVEPFLLSRFRSPGPGAEDGTGVGPLVDLGPLPPESRGSR